MSEEAEIFRGDLPPEEGQVVSPASRAPVPSFSPAAAAEPPTPAFSPAEPETPELPAAPEPAPVPAVAETMPPLDFRVDESHLWHASEAVRQRLTQLASASHETAQRLDEQEAESARIALRLKSL